MRTWIAVSIVGAVSYAFRLVPLLAAARLQRMAPVERVLRYAGPAAMVALGTTAVRAQAIRSAHPLPVFAAVAITAVLAHLRRPLAVVALAGMATYVIVAAVS
jgi:branched-subunit amino acid transport protein